MGKRGRPPKWKTPEDLQIDIESYFTECDNKIIIKRTVTGKGDIVELPLSEPYTIIGLAHHLGVDKETLLHYRDKPDFVGVMTRARNRIHRDMATRASLGLYDSKIANLILASDFGYSTRVEAEVLHDTYEDRLNRLDEGQDNDDTPDEAA